MSGIKTATVEALTAEVRVLMVGSRQITLSVVRQLDAVHPHKIKPFGRVRVARRPRAGGIEIVGSADGALAYSECYRDLLQCSPSAQEARCDEHHNTLIAAGADPERRYLHRVTPTGIDGWLEMSAEPYGGILREHRERPEWWWAPHNWFTYYPDQQLWAEWDNLPLIVLAGLR